MLYHVSEASGIERFEPRSAESGGEPVVWAIDAERLRNYRTPRECPRVTFYAGSRTSAEDKERFLGSSTAVCAIERHWYPRLRACRLYCYRLPSDTFKCIDECAGYFVSREPVSPIGIDIVDDSMAELLRRGVELRILANLWALRDAVVRSTLQFSIIRMRNALPRAAA